MARLRRLEGGLALLVLVLISPNLASKEDACRPACRGYSRSGDFKYQEGTTYKYNFQSAIQISLSDTKGGQQSTTGVKGTVLLSPESPCSHSLRLENVEVVGSNSQRFSHIDGITMPIQFHFHEGVIGDHICADPNDRHNSLNIKRAIASLFQVDTEHSHETDVFGVCPTEGSIATEGGDVVVTKVRDLDECAFRESIKEDFMVSSFDTDSDFKTSPMMTGEYSSQQRIKNGILDKAYVFENYTYLAFTDAEDKDELGAKARVVTKLEFVGTTRERAQTSRGGEPKSIIFDNPHPITAERINMDSITDAIRKLKGEDETVVGEHAARDFLDLVKILRASNKDDMLIAFRQVKAGAGFRDREGARKVFLDALFRCGTGNAIVVGVELLKSRELAPLEEKLVYLSFAFVKHATLSALEAASSLLDTNQLPREAYLGIGNLAGRYCREHQCNVDAVSRLTQGLAAKLGYGRVYTRNEENEIIFVLKALANIQHLDEGVLAKVTGIAQDKGSPNRLRVAALETYLSDACHESARSAALRVLKDIQEDSELRIKAYLVLAKCPNAQVASSLKSLLEEEPSYQVGGFIVSHLRNLKASANPDRQTAQRVLAGVSTNKKFPIDPRKYSFNGEFSYDLNELGVSSSVEANVIYSQNSFLPRSTNLNLTAELFGHNINFLEIGTRQQNLDRLLEHYFGPLGVFNRATPEEVKQSGLDTFSSIVEHFNRRFERVRGRGKRDVSKSEIDNFGRQVEIRTNELNNELDLDLSIKLFGSELFFLSVSDDTENLSPDDIIDRVFDAYERDLTRSTSFDHNFQTNSLFLDTEFTYPTSMGFPLRLGIEGTSSVQVKAKGDIDLGAILDETPNAGVFKLSLIPSASVEVAASIMLDAQVFESGLKVVSNLYTATGADIEVNLQDRARGMEAKFSLPLQKQKIISATHEVVLNTREIGKPEVITPITFTQNKDFNLCVNDLSPLLGLNLCMDMNAPPTDSEEGPLLAGNYKFVLAVDNEDFSHFHYKEQYHNDPRSSKLGGEVVAEVIGKRQNQKLALKLEAFYVPEVYVKASLVSPITTGALEARITSTDNELSVSCSLQRDNQRYSGKAGLAISRTADGNRYTPILEYHLPGYSQQKLPINFQGSVFIESKRAYNVKIIFEDLKLHIDDLGALRDNRASRGTTYSINGNVGQADHDYFSDLTLSEGYFNVQLNGKLHLQRNLLNLDGQVKNSRDPQANVRVLYEFKRHPTEIDSSFQLIHGPDPNSQQNRLTISDSLIYRRLSDYDYEVKTKNKVSYPLMNFDAQFDYAATPKTVFYDVEVKYDRLIIGSELDLKYSQRAEGDYDLDFQIYDADDEVELKAKLDIQGDLWRVDNALVVNGAKYELSGTVSYRDNPHEVDSNADLLLRLPQSREPLQIHEEWKVNSNQVHCVLKINDHYQQYVDLTLTNSKENSNGNLKINIPNQFALSAHGRETRGTGNGEITLDYIPGGISMKADTTFTIADPTYNVRLTLYPEFNRNRGRYLSVTSNNQIRDESIVSKNTFDAGGSKTQLNYALSEEDQDNSGKLAAELDLTMPDGDFGAFRYNYGYTQYNQKLNSEQSVSVEARGLYDWRNAKITAKEILKDVDVEEDTYDYTYLLDSDDGEGRAGHFEVGAKRALQGAERVSESALIKIYGNRPTDGLEASAGVVYDDWSGTYNVLTSYGDYLFDANGKYDVSGVLEDDAPIMEEITIKMKTPNPDLRNMKIAAAVSVGEHELPEGYLEIKGSGAFSLNEEESPVARYSQNQVIYSGSGDLKIGTNDGTIKLSMTSHNAEPVTIAGNYEYAETDASLKFKGYAGVQYARYKNIRTDLAIDMPNEHELKIDLGLEPPETAPIRIQIVGKESEKGEVYKSEAVITTNNGRFVLVEEVDLRDTSPGFNVQLTYPNGQVDQILARLKFGRTIEGEAKVQLHEHNFALESRLDARIDSEEDFSVKFTANCPRLEIFNLVADIQNTPLNSAAPQNLLGNRFGDSNPRPGHNQEDPRYTTEDPRYNRNPMYNQAPRQNNRDRRYEDPRYTTPDPMYNQDPRYQQDPRYNQDPRHDNQDHRYEDSRYTTEDPRYNRDPMYKQAPRHDNRDPRYEDPRYTTPDPRYNQDSRYNQDHRYEDPRYTTEDPRHNEDPYRNQDPRYDTRDPRYGNQDQRQGNQDPRYDSQDQRHDGEDPWYNNRDPRYGNQDSRYDTHGSQQQTRDSMYRYKRSADQRYGDQTYGQSGYGETRRRDPNSRAPRYEPQSAAIQSHGERLRVSVQHAGRNLLSGTATYQIRQQGETLTIEGGGSLTVKEGQPKQHTYKIVRQKVYSGRGGGEGLEYTWNLDANSDVLDGKLRITDREFAFVTTLCEQRSQCLRAQAESTISIFGSDHFEIRQKLEVDLRRLGWHEVGIGESIEYRGNVFDSTGELYFDKRNKYQYKLYGDDRMFEASFTTPIRMVSLEGKIQAYGRNRAGPSSIQIDLYLDKRRQPQQKSSITGLVDCRGGDDIGKCNVELKFTNPALRKDLTVVYTANYNYPQANAEYNLILDIFSNPNNKIVCTGKFSAQRIGGAGGSALGLYEIKSQGLDIDIKYEETLVYDPQYAREFKYNYLIRYHVGRATYDSTATVKYNPEHVLLLVKVLNREVVNVDVKINTRGNAWNALATVRGMGFPPSTVNVDLTDTSLKGSVHRIDNPSERLEVNAKILGGTLLDINVEYYERGRPYKLLTTYVRVNSRDELETLYEYDQQNIQRLVIQPAKAEYANMKRELSFIKESAERDLNNQMQMVDEHAKWDLPDFNPMGQYYQRELNQIGRELNDDRALQEFARFVEQFLEPMLIWLWEFTKRVEEIRRNSMYALGDKYRDVMRTIDTELKPWLRENSDKLAAAAGDTWESAERLILAVVDEVLHFVNRHEKEIKNIGGLVIESLEDVIVFAVKAEREIERKITEEFNKLYSELKSMAVFDELDRRLKEALEGRPIPESYIRNFREAVNNLKDSTHSPVVKKLIAVLGDYIEQKLRRQPVDDAVAIQSILHAVFDVLVDVYYIFEAGDQNSPAVSWEAIYAIPKLIEAELSPVTYLFHGDWPDLEELLESASLDLDDWSLPEDMDAFVAQGRHIFTFDGKHVLFPGGCDYLYAHDAVNGNFSIVGSYRSGELTSVTFADKHDAVTITKGGHVLLNQAPAEYPVRKQHRLEVHRDYESIKIWSKAGVSITCGPDLLVCGFHISGYYHAQLRGLLGNGNNEPYDDYTLPNGMITTKEADFGHSYSVGGRCADVPPLELRVRPQRNPACSRLFSSGSPLSSCFNFVDQDIFRTACDRGTAAGVRDTERAIAVAYVAACATKGLSLEVPQNLVTCQNYDKPVRVDEEFSVTTPARSADIVIIVDQDKSNEFAFRELVQPLTSDLTSALAREGISDVDFHLIGYGGEYEKRPAHYTVDGKLTFKGGRAPNVLFSNPPKETARETFMEYVERLNDEVELLTGQDMLSEAYFAAADYPFRANALKSIIVLNGKPCEEAQLEVIQTLSSLFVLNKQLTVNLFSPFKGIDPRNPTTSNVIGFNEHTIFSFSNPTGSKQTNAIEHNNFCVEFALKNRGNVFVVNNLLQGRSKQQFIQVASQTIAKELTSVEQWLDCKCEMVSPYTAQNVCTVKKTRPRQAATRAPQRRRQHG